ncbi:MAG TPA: ThuA domain-containing protein [Thermoanaerobaculia bacterium]|nr:ThuA domain-containing protein [Thermoanaerobaculia bacterium]
MRRPRAQIALALVSLLALLVPVSVAAQHAQNTEDADGPRVLFLGKSSGFEHSSIRRVDGALSHVERVLAELARRHGFELEATKDASRINAGELARFDVVVFYTTGDLTRRGGEGGAPFAGDGEPAMASDGLATLLAWIRAGGGFVGYHSASDTFHSDPARPGEVSPYVAMLGGEFETHGAQFEGLVRVFDPDHPVTRDAPPELRRLDEWYVFRNLAVDAIHVLRVLDPGTERERQPLYDRDPYPVVWTRTFGDGRVYYDAMGHREDVWDDPEFQGSVVRALRWAAGEGPAASEPNFLRGSSP